MVSGLLTGLIVACCVPMTYFFIAVCTENRDAAFFGASFFALCPSLLLFFPDFDPCFPVLTAALGILWALALKRKSWVYAAGFGVMYAITGLITYLPGILPIFFVGYTIVQSRAHGEFRWGRAFTYLGIALGVGVAFYGLLWLASGFNPISTLVECARQNAILWDKLINKIGYPRHSLPWTFFTDLYDFALGSGWISFVIAGAYFLSVFRKGFNYEAKIAVVSVLQFLVIAAVGLLQTETARIWIFMYPMLMVPIGLELARWPRAARVAVYVALLIITAAMCQSMEFMQSAY
jgi:hypothetical protein